MTVHLQSSGSLFIISRLELAVNEFPESAPKTNKKGYEIKMKMFSMSRGRVNETKYSRLIKTVVLILLVKLCCEN